MTFLFEGLRELALKAKVTRILKGQANALNLASSHTESRNQITVEDKRRLSTTILPLQDQYFPGNNIYILVYSKWLTVLYRLNSDPIYFLIHKKYNILPC